MWRKWQNCDILCQYESLKFYEFDTNIIDPNLTTVDRMRPQLTAGYKFTWKWKSEKLSISSKIVVLNQVLDQKWHLFLIVGSIWSTWNSLNWVKLMSHRFGMSALTSFYIQIIAQISQKTAKLLNIRTQIVFL